MIPPSYVGIIIIINHEIRIPVNQPGFSWKVRDPVFFWWQKQTWCLCGVLMWHQLRRWTSMLWVTLSWGIGQSALLWYKSLWQLLGLVGKMLTTEVQVGEFKPNTFPKPTKGMHCLLVVVSKHLLFKIELSLLIPSKSSWQKIIRSSNILRRSHNEIYMSSSYCIKSSSLDPLESDGWRKVESNNSRSAPSPFWVSPKTIGFSY